MTRLSTQGIAKTHSLTSRAISLTQAACAICALILPLAAAGYGNSSTPPPPPVAPKWVFSSTDDVAQPPSGILTLRSALDQAASGDTINFDTSLNGATIELNLIGVSQSTLLGETYSGMTFQGYAERDYGKSAIYAKKNIELDATSLPNGITIKWAGGDTNPARVLAVYGDLTLRNVNITGGYS